nr:9772_t:CDS:2 [Entrophospora candida]
MVRSNWCEDIRGQIVTAKESQYETFAIPVIWIILETVVDRNLNYEIYHVPPYEKVNDGASDANVS